MTDGKERVDDESTLLAASVLYRESLAGRAHDSLELCGRRPLSDGQVSGAANLLRRLGLVRPVEGDERELVPIAPDAALRACLDADLADATRFARGLVQRRAEIDAIVGCFRDIYAEQLSSGEIEIVRGAQAISEAVENAEMAARETAVALHPSPPGDLRRASRLNERSAKRGIAIRTVHLSGHAGQHRVDRYLRSMVADGVSVRLAESLPCRMIVVDSSFAVLWIEEETESGEKALVVRSAPLTQFAARIFEHFWSVALPWPAPGRKDREFFSESRRRQLIQFMMSGMHDDAIARRLGVSVRTIRRLIADLMSELGAESRFQAGVLVASAGWPLPGGGSGDAGQQG